MGKDHGNFHNIMKVGQKKATVTHPQLPLMIWDQLLQLSNRTEFSRANSKACGEILALLKSWQASHPGKARISFTKPDAWNTDAAFNGKVLTKG